MAPFADLSPNGNGCSPHKPLSKTIPAEQYLLEKDTPSDTLYMLTHGDVLVEADHAVMN